MTSIMLVEDHASIRKIARQIIEREPDLHVVAELADGVEALAALETTEVDVLLADLSLPGMHGLTLVRAAHQLLPQLRIAVMTNYAEEPYIDASFDAGALAYVHKSVMERSLVAAIRAVAEGRFFLRCPDIVADPLASIRDPALAQAGELTPRERQVVKWAARGENDLRISARLQVSASAVAWLRRTLMVKLGLTTHEQLIRFAARKGLV